MVAEIGDLAGFWPDKPTGVTRQNIYSVLSLLQATVSLGIMETHANKALSSTMRNALVKAQEQEASLVSRLLHNFNMTIEE